MAHKNFIPAAGPWNYDMSKKPKLKLEGAADREPRVFFDDIIILLDRDTLEEIAWTSINLPDKSMNLVLNEPRIAISPEEREANIHFDEPINDRKIK